MPAMLRPSKKAEKIAYAILGKPQNMVDVDKKRNKKREKIIDYQNSTRSK